MLFKIKDLDEPLHVLEPVRCKLCRNTVQHNDHCTYCKTMREAVKALNKHRLPDLKLPFLHDFKGNRTDANKTSRRKHELLPISNLVS